jgi:hypothetical protein
MSKVAIQGNAAGTGTFTVAAPNSNNDQTLNLPDHSGTLSIEGPSFSAYQNAATSLTNGSVLSLIYGFEELDSSGCYDPVAGRFTPNVAGWYQVNVLATLDTLTSGSMFVLAIVKNSAVYRWGCNVLTNANAFATSCGTALVFCNGTTDFIGVAASQVSGGTLSTKVDSSARSHFSAFLVKAT